MKNSILVTIILFLFVACSSIKEGTQKPSILFIVVDDQGHADFEPLKNHDPQIVTPNMSRLANSGMIFTQAYTTAPVCSPSRVGMLTGKFQIRWDKEASWAPGLPDSVKTIAEYLQEAGYTTARFGKNDLGLNFHKYNVREYPLNHGYDEFLGFNAHAHDYWLLSDSIRNRTPDPYGTSAVLGPLMHNMGEKSYDEGYLTEILTEEAIAYIKNRKEKPFFMTLAYNSVHHLIHEVPDRYLKKFDVKSIPNYNPDSMIAYSYQKPGSYSAYYDKYTRLGDIQDEDLRKYYLANLDCLDENIGRVLDVLKEEGLSDETIIIYISDNGGSPLTGANNFPLTAGKYSLWEGGIRVPMAISWPGKIKSGVVQDQIVSAADILPTITNELGIAVNDSTIDGINLLNPDPDRILVWKWQQSWAIRKGDWKLTNTIENHWKSRPSNQYIKPIVNDLSLKLFNITEDPSERNNLVDKFPERVKELELEYKNWCEKNIGKY